MTDITETERLAQVDLVLKEAALVELATLEAKERAAINARRAKFKSGGIILDWSTGQIAVFTDNVIPFIRTPKAPRDR